MSRREFKSPIEEEVPARPLRREIKMGGKKDRDGKR